jgi:DNA polymerase-1
MSEEIPTGKKKLAIIDGKSVFYRGYYAMPNLSTKDGTATGGVFGFATLALEVIKRLKPDYVCVAWDKPKTNIRKRLEMYPEYKAGRKPAPPDFYEQIPILHELLDAFGWPLYELDDYEADDIMGTLAVQASAKDIETMLITSDMDMLQLVDPHVHVFAMKKGLSNIELYSPKSFEAKYGIKATQFLDLKALKGDSSDNIPGVPGVGEKGAIDLLKQFDTLDGVYDNLGLIKDSLSKKLEAGKDSAYLSKKLAAIWTDAPIKLNLKEVDGTKAKPEQIRDILQRLEFRSLVARLPQVMQLTEEPGEPKAKPTGLSVGSDIYIDTKDKLASIDLGNPDALFIHSRAAGKHGRDPLVLALSTDSKKVYILDISALGRKAVASFLKPYVSVPLIGYDVKSSLKVLLELGLTMPPVKHDVLIGAFLINSLRREQSLTELAETDLGYSGTGFEKLSDKELIGLEADIIAVIKALYLKQLDELKAMPKVEQVAQNIEWPVIPVLASMEYEGIALNTKKLEKFADELSDMVSDFEQQIYGHADEEFNISSPTQLAEILFEKLKLPKQFIKRGKTGYSTAASELDKLRGLHPIVDLITQYREVTKLKNTYVDVMPKMVDENSRLHTTFALTVAQTGRLSSNDPNLQNIPVRTELGKRIRTAFEAGKGKVFVSADYSQFELRLAAAIAGDQEMIKAFNEDQDIHRLTAAQVMSIKPEEVSDQQRYQAKAVNFGIMYGQGPHALAQQTGMSFGDARAFIARYFEIRPKLKQFIENTKEKAKNDGYVETLLGRRRPTPDVHSSNFVVREAAYRAAVNMPLQGTAADLTKLAMIKVNEKLDGDSKMLLQIHDSIMVEVPEKHADKAAKMMKETMEQVYDLPVKLTVDIHTGKTWGEL